MKRRCCLGRGVLALSLCVGSQPAAVAADVPFVRGDTNSDGEVNIGDFWLPEDVEGAFNWHLDFPCDDAADANDDGTINITDAIFILNWLFLGGPAPPDPGPEAPGVDPTADDLICASYDPAPVEPVGAFMLSFQPSALDIVCPSQPVPDIYVTLTSGPDNTTRAQGWSYGVEMYGGEGDEIVSVTTSGTSAAEQPEGLRDDLGFEVTCLVDPARNGGRRGFVSSVLLSFLRAVEVPAGTTTRIARMSLSVSNASWFQEVLLSYSDDLRGNGPTVRSLVHCGSPGTSPQVPALESCRIRRLVGHLLTRPGDMNQDGVVDLSDEISLLGYLFLGSPGSLPCHGGTDDADNVAVLDSNGDRRLDVSDAIYTLQYLFLGGPLPAHGTGCTCIPECGGTLGCFF